MEANGFFGNWAKYSMENKMTLKKRIESVLLNPKQYDRSYIVGLLSEASYAITSTDNAKKIVNLEEINDYIYDESGGVIGSCGPLKIDSGYSDGEKESLNKSDYLKIDEEPLNKSDYFICKASDLYTIEQMVNKMVKVGYKPSGGIVYNAGVFYQTVFLDKKDLDSKTVSYTVSYDKGYLHF